MEVRLAEGPVLKQCPHCRHPPFSNVGRLRAHIRTCHVVCQYPVVCSVCNFSFGSEHTWEEHLRSEFHRTHRLREREEPDNMQEEVLKAPRVAPDSAEEEEEEEQDLWVNDFVHDVHLSDPRLLAAPSRADAPSMSSFLIDTADEQFQNRIGQEALAKCHSLRAAASAPDASKFEDFMSMIKGYDDAKRISRMIHAEMSIPAPHEVDMLFGNAKEMVLELQLGTRDETPVLLQIIPPELIFARWLDLREHIVQEPVEAPGGRISRFVEAARFKHICESTRRVRSEHSVLLALFLYSDATTIVKRGTRSLHPMYLTLANAESGRFEERDRSVMLGFMPSFSATQLGRMGIPSGKQSLFRAHVFQRTLDVVLHMMGVTTAHPHGLFLKPMTTARQGQSHLHVVPILAGVLADRPERLQYAGKFVSQNASSLKQPCVTCGIQGSELEHENASTLPLPSQGMSTLEIEEHITIIESSRGRGGIGDSRQALKDASRVAVMPALSKCHSFTTAVNMPRCTLHSLKIVISTYLLTWVISYLESKADNDVQALRIVMGELNTRAHRIEPAIERVYYTEKSKAGWKLAPEILTGQHRVLALKALTFALHGLFFDNVQQCKLTRCLCSWQHVYARLTARVLLPGHSNLAHSELHRFRREAVDVFGNQSRFNFPTWHELLHMPLDLDLFGPHLETTTETGEKLHKVAVKVNFDLTSKRKDDTTPRRILSEYALKNVTTKIVAKNPPADGATSNANGPFRLIGRGKAWKWGQLEVAYTTQGSKNPDVTPTTERRRWRNLLELWAAESKSAHAETWDLDDVGPQEVRVHDQCEVRVADGEWQRVMASIDHRGRARMRDVVADGQGNHFLVLLIFSSTSYRTLPVGGQQETLFFCQELDRAQLTQLVCPVFWVPFVQAVPGRYVLMKPFAATNVYESTPLCSRHKDLPQQYLLYEKEKQK